MSKPEYTEGPWVWGHSGIDGLWVGPFDETPVAIVPHDGGLEGVPSRDNSRNNARLIAAAPLMYKYLTVLAEGGDNKAHGIIKKITGP